MTDQKFVTCPLCNKPVARDFTFETQRTGGPYAGALLAKIGMDIEIGGVRV